MYASTSIVEQDLREERCRPGQRVTPAENPSNRVRRLPKRADDLLTAISLSPAKETWWRSEMRESMIRRGDCRFGGNLSWWTDSTKRVLRDVYAEAGNSRMRKREGTGQSQHRFGKSCVFSSFCNHSATMNQGGAPAGGAGGYRGAPAVATIEYSCAGQSCFSLFLLFSTPERAGRLLTGGVASQIARRVMRSKRVSRFGAGSAAVE